jgi:predicted alpha/beta superfamily hydrolase
MHLRPRDFVRAREEGGEQFIQEHFPVRDPITSGNAGPFLLFLQQEPILLIQSDYQADPSDIALLGHSGGADFTSIRCFSNQGCSNDMWRPALSRILTTSGTMQHTTTVFRSDYTW